MAENRAILTLMDGSEITRTISFDFALMSRYEDSIESTLRFGEMTQVTETQLTDEPAPQPMQVRDPQFTFRIPEDAQPGQIVTVTSTGVSSELGRCDLDHCNNQGGPCPTCNTPRCSYCRRGL